MCSCVQYYAMLGGDRYVDLGLGTHRVKCRVDRQFRYWLEGSFFSVMDSIAPLSFDGF